MKASTSGQRLLREHLEKDAPQREASVARFMSIISAVSGTLALALGPMISWPLAVTLAALLAVLTAYYVVLGAALKRGLYARFVPWLNTALEVSMPALIFVVDARWRGPEYALTAPPLVLWGTLVGLSSLRGSRAIALGAGALAALESIVLYAVLAWPQLPEAALVTLQPPLIATRAFLLFCAGAVTAVFVGHFNRRAEEAFAAARARDLFGKYILHERIGAGGMAEVFRATYGPEGGFEKTVAVKRILPGYSGDAAFLALFRAEAELCSRLNHPNIVGVLDFGRHDDTYYLAMEYVDGLSLQRLLVSLPDCCLPLPALTYVGIELLAALDYLSRRVGPDGEPLRLVHRDVNPPNLLVSSQGEVKLADFGIARASSRARLTAVGTIKGKPGYLAPEQLTDDDLDGAADAFSAGITLWEAATGRHLFPVGESDAETKVILVDPIEPPSAHRPHVPEALDRVIGGLLERDKAKRLTAAQALELLRRVDGPAAAFPAGPVELGKAVRVVLAQAKAPTTPGMPAWNTRTQSAKTLVE